jgi:hypothetical protein
VFYDIGKPLRVPADPTKKGCPIERAAAMPQPSPGRSVVDVCRPVCLLGSLTR